MKKVLVAWIGAYIFLFLIGCVAKDEEALYKNNLAKSLPLISQSYAELYDLLTSPNGYTDYEWENQFAKSKREIEIQYNRLEKLAPYVEAESEHERLLVSMSELIESNHSLKNQLEQGEHISHSSYLKDLNDSMDIIQDASLNMNELSKNTQEF